MRKIRMYITAGLIFMAAAVLRAQPTSDYEREGEKIRVTHYYENGDIRETGTYLNGKPHGKWIQYDREGAVAFEANYEEGFKEGKWFKWMDSGSVLYEMVYNKNSLVNVQKWRIEERNMLAGE